MEVYRITKQTYAHSLEGKGGLLFSGRWHKKGHPVIYASENISLAAWEVFINITDYRNLPRNLVVVTIHLPDDIVIQEVPGQILVTGWNNSKPYKGYKEETVNFGTKFLYENQYLILKIPSAVIENEYNFLINPRHPDISRCNISKVEKFEFDRRINR